MLDARAQPARDQTPQQRQEASGEASRDEAERRRGRSRREKPRLAPALREESRRDLEGGHAAAVDGAQEPDLGERQAELARPHR